MSHNMLIAAAAGLIVGYFAATQLAEYQPFKTAYAKGVGFGQPAA